MTSDDRLSADPPWRRRISVALATFNGERFLEEQLRSLADQTFTPFELVVSDDGSADRSVEILTRFAAQAPFPVRIRVNAHRGGVAKNFSDALSRTTGELVALCDQDDVWAPEKLAVMARAFDAASVTAAACDADLVDAAGAPLGESLWRRQGFSGPRRADFVSDPFSALLRANPISGVTTIFRAHVVQRALPIPGGAIHDWWLLLMASTLGTVRLVEDPLVSYRQHDRNAIGARTASPVAALRRRQQARAEPVWTEDALFRALAARGAVPGDRLKDLEAKLALLEARDGAGSGRLRRSLQIVRALARGDYHRFARGVPSALVDLLDAFAGSSHRQGPRQPGTSAGC